MLDHEFLASIPNLPGVYLMLDRKSTVLYVGKAKNLHHRLASYVRFSGPRHSKTAVMLSRVDKVDTLITHTEKEALILEASLIKKHRPKYNVILRDDKSYPFIKVTIQETWPRVSMTRRKKKDGARYFGPYASSSAMWATLRQLGSLFPLRRCKGPELRPRKRPCLNHQLNNCLAPCADLADQQQYRQMVDQVLLFLEGRNQKLLGDLQAEMNRAAQALEFEKAALLRDRLRDLNRTLEKQVVISRNSTDRDVFGFCRQGVSVAVALLVVRQGAVGGSRNFYFEDPYGNDPAIIAQIVKQLYDEAHPPPVELLLPGAIDDREVLLEHLSDLAGRKVTLTLPRRGEPRKLMEMATANAAQLFAEQEQRSQSWQKLCASMVRLLRLRKPPLEIECLDISTISGTNSVGALVCFREGEPDKRHYRHYRISTIEGPDDYGMIRETLDRRFTRGLETNDLPDLLLIDGGKGQLGVAMAAARAAGVEDLLDVAAIAKDKNGQGEKLYLPGRKNPLMLQPHNPVLLQLMRVRDEAHRFGITFHRSLRKKATLASGLDRIPGIGTSRKKLLLSRLGSLKRISKATAEELQQLPGIGPRLAREIVTHLNPTNRDRGS